MGARQRTGFVRVALRQEQAAEEGGGRRCKRLKTGEEWKTPPYVLNRQCFLDSI